MARRSARKLSHGPKDALNQKQVRDGWELCRILRAVVGIRGLEEA
jgi:hypothetical protein